MVDDILDSKPAGLVSLSTDFEDVDEDMYRARGRKVVDFPDNATIQNDTTLFTISPVA